MRFAAQRGSFVAPYGLFYSGDVTVVELAV
jgi:hypothetical protein